MRTFTIALILALLAALPSAAQPETLQLVSDHPAVKAAVERYFAEQATAATSAKSAGARFATAGPVYGGGYSFATPPVALRLNRMQFDEHDVLQASLVILPGRAPAPDRELPAGPVHVSVLTVHMEGSVTRGTYAGMHVLMPGQTIPLQTYIFEGSEAPGIYAYIVMVYDAGSGQLLMMPGTRFVFRNFIRSDNSGSIRVDSAELYEPNPRYIILRGNFALSEPSGLNQTALIGSRTFPIIKSDGRNAAIDLGYPGALPAGVYDITILAHRDGNTAYDSTTAPCVLRLFLPSGKG